jgi:hypothetical protein
MRSDSHVRSCVLVPVNLTHLNRIHWQIPLSAINCRHNGFNGVQAVGKMVSLKTGEGSHVRYKYIRGKMIVSEFPNW